MAEQTYQAGDRVYWQYAARGGYGYGWPVPATVVVVGASRVQIDAVMDRGGVKRIWVARGNIRPRKGDK